MDKIFKAMADATRRALLDRLFDHPGQTLNALCEGTAMRRQSVTKHLKLLEDAGLVVIKWQGRKNCTISIRSRSPGSVDAGLINSQSANPQRF